MHELGSSPIGCEDFNFQQVSQMGYRYRVVPYQGFVQPRTGQGKARLNYCYNNFVGSFYIYIFIVLTNYLTI